MTAADRPPALGFLAVLLLTVDGLVWWLAGATQLPLPVMVVLLGLIAAAPLIWYGRKLAVPAPQGRNLRPYVLVAVGQLVAIAIAVAVLAVTGAWWLLPGIIAAIHGLGWLTARNPSRTALGIALLLIGALGVLLGLTSGSASRAMVIVGLPVAAALWCVPAVAMVRQFRAGKTPGQPFHLSDLDDDDAELR